MKKTNLQSYWIQISSGRGPAECEWAVAEVSLKFIKEAKAFGIQTERISEESGFHPKTYQSVLIRLEGENISTFLSQWKGSVLWIGKSPYRPQHKRKNWFINVESFEEPCDQELDLSNITVRFARSSGPGGQNVNKVESSVRVVHNSSGLEASASEERTQNANRKLALAKLYQKLQGVNQVREENEKSERWNQHNNLVRGNPVRSFKA